MTPTYTISIIAAEKINVQESNTNLLSVQFSIQADRVDVQTLRHGFPLDTTPETVNAELQKVLETFLSDKANAERYAVSDAENAQADETIAAIVGTEITNNEVAI